ncbi:ribonuclease H-like domain-containing protein [Peziza echinospora]|nr:ribonuclease H-like domain-containing protein [Peziza echinospora]
MVILTPPVPSPSISTATATTQDLTKPNSKPKPAAASPPKKKKKNKSTTTATTTPSPSTAMKSPVVAVAPPPKPPKATIALPKVRYNNNYNNNNDNNNVSARQNSSNKNANIFSLLGELQHAYADDAGSTVQPPLSPTRTNIKTPFQCTCCNKDHGSAGTLQLHLAHLREMEKAEVQRRKGNVFTRVVDSAETRGRLEALVHGKEGLGKLGYVFPREGDAEEVVVWKCSRCYARKSEETEFSECHSHAQGAIKSADGTRFFPCCNLPAPAPSCQKLPSHTFLAKPPASKKTADFISTPPRDPANPKRFAVALDCEMGTAAQTNGSELIQLCVVDYFTSETLLALLVHPRVPLLHYNTKWSGITRKMMEAAVRANWYLSGWEEARERLFEFVDADTILIGHSLGNDLRALKVFHGRFVDSFVAVSKRSGVNHSLKNLCEQVLGMEVQCAGKKGHDCVEDALAARELVVWRAEDREGVERWERGE